MKITLAKNAGFCFGVKRALGIALESARKYKPVYMLGDIVHNETVVRQIQELGIRKIKSLSKAKKGYLLIRAHGAAKATFAKARKLGYKIIDATCPMVREIHKTAEDMENRGYRIIIAGDKNHDEVKGIIGQLKQKPLVVSNSRKIPVKKLKNINKACLIAQSTQNFDKTLETAKKIKKYIPDLIFKNTICSPTRKKQKEIKQMPKQNDLMIIIGSKSSANTRRLYQISKKENPKTYWVNSGRALRKNWFKSVKKIGVTAGASTPQETINEVLKTIRVLTLE